MNDTTTEHDDFLMTLGQAHMNLVASEADQRQQDAYLKSIILGQIAKALMSFDGEQLEAVRNFIANGCEPEQIIDSSGNAEVEALRRELDSTRQKLASAERERDAAKSEKDKLPRSKFLIDLVDQQNVDDFNKIFGLLRTGDQNSKRFVSNYELVIRAGFQKLQEDAARAEEERTKVHKLPDIPPSAPNGSTPDSKKSDKGPKRIPGLGKRRTSSDK